MMDTGLALESKLEALVVDDPDFAELCRLEDRFCPFEAIGMVRQEIRHAHFLAYCLDPQRPHGFGNAALRALLRAAAREGASSIRNDKPQLGALDIHLMEFQDVDVRREWQRTDLLCVAEQEKLIVAIELKIDSREHGTQLGRYRAAIEEVWPKENGWKHVLILLTKNGDDPTPENGGEWCGVELSALASELELLCANHLGRAEARSLLQSYLSMLRYHHLENTELTNIAERLWRKHEEALSFLMDNRPDYGVFGELKKNVSEILARIEKSSGIKVECDKISSNLLFISVPKWRSLPGFQTAQNWTSSRSVVLIILERIRGEQPGINIRLEIGPSEPEIRQAYFDRFKARIRDLRRKRSISAKYTRICSASYVPEDKCDDPLTWCLDRIEEWSGSRLAAADEALADLPPGWMAAAQNGEISG